MSQIRREPSLRNYATIAALDAAVIGEGNVPAAGGTGEVLAKASTTDFDTEWVTRADLAQDTAFSSRYALLHLIDEVVTDGGTGAVTFSAIPGTWMDLVVEVIVPTSSAVTSLFLRCNGDSDSGDYASGVFFPRPTESAVSYGTNATRLEVGSVGTLASFYEAVLTRYAKTEQSQMLARGWRDNTTANVYLSQAGGVHRSAAAITSLTVQVSNGAGWSIAPGTRISLYGRGLA